MQKTKHAEQIADRFRSLVEDADHSLADEHYDELILLIEAGIDTALFEKLEKMADKLSELSNSVRNDAEFFD